MRFMRNLFVAFLVLVVLPLMIIAGVIFFKPLLILNPHLLAWGLNKSNIFESWSWKSARFSHERFKLLHRNFEGEFKDFCFKYNKPTLKYETCFESISWNIDVIFSFHKGGYAVTKKPFVVSSSFTNVTLVESDKKKKPSGPPDVKKYWNLLWNPIVPDMDFTFQEILLKSEKKTFNFFVVLNKQEKDIRIEIPKFRLDADPSGFVLKAMEEIPVSKYVIRDLQLTGKMKKNGIPFYVDGDLNSILFSLDSFVSLPLKGEFTSVPFIKDVLLRTIGEVRFMDVKKNLRHLSTPHFNELPAPLNVMDGNIIARLGVTDKDQDEVNILLDAGIRLKSSDQVIDVDIGGRVPFNVKNYSTGLTEIGIDFNQFKLNLPKFSKKATPPQLKPDGRFKTHEEIMNPKPKKEMPVLLNLTALNEKSMNIESNLLDQVLKLNFDLHISENGLDNGYIRMLPLKTTILKRVIKVKSLVVQFESPLTPVIKASLQFPLPEYKISMELEGPVNEPRYAFSSDPPLAESDIFSVLIYGRPMEDLDASDRSSASASTQILSQGILSLTTLYLLSGTPIEAVGYNQENKTAFAQIGLGSKSSLRVGGGREGVNSTDLRRSLGKGWFIDTSVQDTNTGVNTGRTQDFGVMLERIIAY